MDSLDLLVASQLITTNLHQERIFIAPVSEQLFTLQKQVLSEEEQRAVDRLLNAIRYVEGNYNHYFSAGYTNSNSIWVAGQQSQFARYSAKLGTEWYQGNFAVGLFAQRFENTLTENYSSQHFAGSYLAYAFPKLSISIAQENLHAGPAASGLLSSNRFYTPPITLQLSNGRQPLHNAFINHGWDLTLGHFDKHGLGQLQFVKAASHHVLNFSSQISAELAQVKTQNIMQNWQNNKATYVNFTFTHAINTNKQVYSRLDYQTTNAALALTAGFKQSLSIFDGSLSGFIETRLFQADYLDWQFLGHTSDAQYLKSDNSVGLNWFESTGAAIKWHVSFQRWDIPFSEATNSVQSVVTSSIPLFSGLLSASLKWQNKLPVAVDGHSALDAAFNWQVRF
ncbi:hypothetical protein GCM10010919_17350 [Alishewanella longhuensis]|uniref:Haemolysin activator HlyB C-terminal domain-containing protein n=2 Tax=Alishewanella longhuensis TaxID=1091037 RepID=A0ABQ3KYU4_9ALTE|nr:hypothetical protein GCM10010919_17350 [Alishewanella longhuensis]